MKNFDYLINTKIIFGKDRLDLELGNEILKISNRILLVYGKNSIKEIGLYDRLIKILKDNDIFYEELSGILPNPRLKDVYKGIDLVKRNNIGLILAVGGGSSIDAAKAIAAGAKTDCDVWDFFLRKKSIEETLSVASILTLSATGSEMNGNSVISNLETKEKLSVRSDLLRPVFSFLDPSLTYSVSKHQTSCGTVDIFMHVLEQYFTNEKDTFLQDRLCEAVLKTCLQYGKKALEYPQNYEARANLMWASSIGLNGLLTYGRIGDWATHMIEHEVSAIYDITHGVGLSILLPGWLKYILSEETLFKFVEYGKNVWGISESNLQLLAEKSIEKTIDFFKSLDMPVKFFEIGIDDKDFELIASQTVRFGDIGIFRKLNKDDVLNILRLCK